MNAKRHRQPATPRTPGWGRLLGFALAEGYLVFLATLAAIAFLPALFGWSSTVVQTGSMEPHISPGDAVVLSPTETGDPVNVGGVVQFRSPAQAEPDGVPRLRLHRIVEDKGDGTFVTAGDANADVDSSPLHPEQITGQARILVPWIGLPGLWATTGNFVAVLGWGVATLLALFMVFIGPGRRTADDRQQAVQPPPDEPTPSRGGLPRRTALVVVGLGAAGLLAGTRLPSSVAGFSTGTSTKASWSVAKLPELTLGRAASYLLLADERIQHSPLLGVGTSISGSVATSPGTRIEGFWPWDISGNTDRNTTGARNAKTDQLTLYAALDKYPATRSLDPVLSGTLKPGVYTSSTGRFTISGTLTLDAGGDPSARFIFRAQSIVSASGSTVVLSRGAAADRVFWRSTGAIDLGTSSTNRGVYLAHSDAELQSRSTLAGRLYSCTGAITVTRATVTAPSEYYSRVNFIAHGVLIGLHTKILLILFRER